MWVNRTSLPVAFGLLVCLLASTAFGQDMEGVQLGAPADLSTFGGPIEPNEGYFFQFDGLYWSIGAPKTETVGANGLTRTVYYGPNTADARVEKNTLTTCDLIANFSVGQRYEFGNIEDRNGWFVSIFQVRNQGLVRSYAQADVVFNDPVFGTGQRLLQGPVPLNPHEWPGDPLVVVRDLPVTLYNIMLYYQVRTWGVEANYLHRTLTCHGGNSFEFFGGARYVEFCDTYGIQAGGDPGGHIVPSFLADSSWYTNAENHIIGPQVGLRWFKKQGRWTFSTEGRFMAGLNCQNVRQAVNMGPHLNPGGVSGNGDTTGIEIYTPTAMSATMATSDAFARVFTPLIELRIEGRYQFTKAISFHAGWTGFWMDNVARATALVNYTVPSMGIDMSNNKQSVLVNGLTLGFDINR